MCGCGSLHPPTAGHVAKGLYCTWLCWNLHLSSSDLSYPNLQAAIWYPVSTRSHSFLFQVVFCFALTTFNKHFYFCLAPRPLRLLLNPGPQLVHLFGIGRPGQFHIFHLRRSVGIRSASWASNGLQQPCVICVPVIWCMCYLHRCLTCNQSHIIRNNMDIILILWYTQLWIYTYIYRYSI